jgi:hypothetical protein
MGIEDLVQVQPGQDGPVSRLDQAIEYWGAPLAPAGAPGTHDIPQAKENPASANENEHSLPGAKYKDFIESAMRFQPHRTLIAASVGVATLAVTALAYMWSSAGEKITAQSPPPIVQTAQSAPGGSGQRVAVSSADPALAVASPDVAASITTEPPEASSSARREDTAPNETVSATQKEDIVFLQRPGVHLRSAPSTNGRVVGTAPKGTRFKVTSREGDWVQVESDRFSGWIRSRFVAANEP